MAEGAYYILKLPHLAIFQLGGVHLHFVGVIACGKLPAPTPMGGADAGVKDKTPCFPLVVGDLPWVVGAGGTGMGGGGAEQGGHCFRSLLAGQPRHLDLAAEELVFQVNRQRSPPDGRRPAAFRWPPPH